MIDAAHLYVLVGAALFVFSAFTSLLSFRLGAPLLLVFLVVGLLAGEDGPGGIDFDNAGVAFLLGSAALAVILFDSGFHTPLASVRAAGFAALTLATLGVVVTAGVFGAAAHAILGLGWPEAFLLGAIVGSTDAAAVFFLLRVGGVTIRERVRATLEVEAGGNDPMAIFLTIGVLALMADGAAEPGAPWSDLGILFAQQMGIGLATGLGGGWLIAQATNRIGFEPGLQPVVVVSLALCLFGATAEAGGSGFLAVYLAGIVAGNMRLSGAARLKRFQDGLTWLCQIGMFLMLGLLATPSEFPAVAAPAIALALVLIFVARPLAVWLCLAPFGFSRRETIFIAFVGLRGAVSILLAIYPWLAGLPTSDLIFNAAFVIVLVSLVTQGWAIAPLARALGLIVPPREGPVDRVELELPGGGRHELVAYRVAPGCPVLRGRRLPRWARPSLILRRGQSMRLHKAGRLEEGDLVFIFIAPERIRLLDRLFQNRADLHDEDMDFYGAFGFAPDTPLASVARVYGLALRPEHGGLSLGEVLTREFGGHVEVGDRLSYGGVELIARRVEDQAVAEIGLSVDPSPPPPAFGAARRLWRALTGGRRPTERPGAEERAPATPGARSPLAPPPGDPAP